MFRRVQVKTSPSQNAPESKRPRIGLNVPKHEKNIGQNVPIKRPHFSKEILSKKYGILAKKKLVLVSGTYVWKIEMMFW